MNSLTEPVLVTRRKDLGVRALQFEKDGHTVELSGLDSVLTILPNGVASFMFEYKTSTGGRPMNFKINPDTAKDYLISKISLNVEFYNVDTPTKTDTLSSYIFSRVF